MQNEHSGEAPGQNKTRTIIVNGRPREFVGHKITYLEVVQLAFPGASMGESIIYTVTYTDPQGKDGELVNGQDVPVKKGMVFIVGKSNRS